MCETMTALALLAGTGLAQGMQGDRIADALKRNADILDLQAADAGARGAQAEDLHRSKVRQILGAQRAAMGASGLIAGEGSQAQTAEATAVAGELDALTVRSNAAREAWGYRMEASNARAQADTQASLGGALKTTALGAALGGGLGYAMGAAGGAAASAAGGDVLQVTNAAAAAAKTGLLYGGGAGLFAGKLLWR